MDLGFAAESLKAIPKDHILARKANDLENVRQMAAHHLDLIKLVLNSYGGKATADQIQQALVPDVIRDDWKKWWETARREIKKDGHFIVPLKKTEPVVFQAQETSLQNRLLTNFRAAKGLKARVAVVSELSKNAADLPDKQGAAGEIITALNTDIATHQRTQPAVALEAIFARDELREIAGLQPAPDEIYRRPIWAQDIKFGPVLEQIPAAKHHHALQSFKDGESRPLGGRAARFAEFCLRQVMPRICQPADCGRQAGSLKESLARLINQHTAGSELLLWLGRERNDVFADILGPEVFRAMLTAMERDQFNEKRSNRLREFILDDQELLAELTASADIEVVKDLTRALQLSPVFDDMDKRSLLARLVKSHPAVQSLISGEQTKQETALLVSWESLERRKTEYQELVQKKIPANSKEIAIARSYGDLSENHEFKAAKEMQKILMRRKDELEDQLTRARGTDFANARTDIVSIGTVVQVTDLEPNQPETFTILGAWDSDPEKGIISYLSPVPQSLLNNKAGDEVEFELHGAKRRHRIERIEAVKAAARPDGVGNNPQSENATAVSNP